MADYENLLDSIDAVIKSNNRREITGQILQNTLHQMVGSLGENYQLAGFATPTLDPNSPDQNVFYITDEAGVYTNFDNITLGAGLSFLMWKNEEWTSKTLDVVTADWLDEHYVSKAFLRKVFQFFDEDGVEIFPNDTESVVDNIKAMCGLWTNEYLSALGLSEGSTIPTTLAALNDVTITNPQDGQALVYDAASLHWVNATIQSGVDMSVVWAALAAATNEQINISHLTTALNDYVTATSLATTLQSYVTTSALATELANYASQSWVETNYISKAFFNSLFQAQDVNGNAITPNNSGQTTIDRLKILVGAYTEQYLSALGLSSGGGGGGSSTLAGLNDVTITNPQDGQALIYDAQSGHWVNGAAISMSAVWTALAAATSEQINSSHLTTALSGYVTTSALASELANYVTTSSLSTTLADYVTTSALATTLADYGSKTWIDNNYVSKAFFNRLFQAFAPLAEGQTEPTQVEPNDTTTTIDNIKAMFGLWTEQYLSALGLSAGGGSGYILNEPLASINSAALGTPSQANVAIVWNGTAWTYGTTISSVSWNDVTNKPTTLAGYGITDAASSSDLANYLPLGGGTISGGINPNADSTINLGTATAKYHYIYAHRLIRLQSIAKGDTYDSYKLDLPDKSGTIAVTSDIPTNNNQLTNGAGYITGITSSMVTSALGYTPANSTSLSNYLPLSGGTMTGGISCSTSGANIVWGNITIYGGGSNGGVNSMLIGDDVTIGDCNVSGCFGMKSTSNTAGFRFFNSVGESIGGLQSTSGTLQWLIPNGTAYDVWHKGNLTNNNQLTNGAGYITGINSTMVVNALGFTPISASGRTSGNYPYYQNATSIDANSTENGWHDIAAVPSNVPTSNHGTLINATTLGTPYQLWLPDASMYIYKRYDSGNTGNWGNWSKIYAGYADSADIASRAICNETSGTFQFIKTYYDEFFDVRLNLHMSQNTGDVNVFLDSGFTNNAITIPRVTSSTHAALEVRNLQSSGVFRGLWVLAPNMPANNILEMSVGTNASIYDLGQITWHRYGSASSSNHISLGIFGVGNILNVVGNGCVGIGTISPYYKLQVAGDIYAEGGVTAASDERLKDVYDNINLSIEQIANAPAVRFYWKADHSKGLQAGTLAQYWQRVLPEVVSDRNNELGMQYGVTALVSVVDVAREVLSQKEEIEMLKNKVNEVCKENQYLREEIDRLKVA